MRMTGLASLGLLVILAQVGRAGEARFKPLPIKGQATTMAITEDGKFVLVAEQAANKVHVLSLIHI